MAYTGIWKGGTRGGLGACPQRGPGAAPRWGVRGAKPPWSWKVSSKIVGEIVQYLIVLFTIDYLNSGIIHQTFNNRKGTFFPTSRGGGGQRLVSPPLKYATGLTVSVNEMIVVCWYVWWFSMTLIKSWWLNFFNFWNFVTSNCMINS